jgi:hypothetical protein
VDPHHVDADLDADPDSTYHPDADPDPDLYWMRIRRRLFTLMWIRIGTQTLEKVLKYAHISYILARHLQIDADPDPDPACHFDADQDFYLMRMRIQVTKIMQRVRIRIHNSAPATCRCVWTDLFCIALFSILVEFILTVRYV